MRRLSPDVCAHLVPQTDRLARTPWLKHRDGPADTVVLGTPRMRFLSWECLHIVETTLWSCEPGRLVFRNLRLREARAGTAVHGCGIEPHIRTTPTIVKQHEGSWIGKPSAQLTTCHEDVGLAFHCGAMFFTGLVKAIPGAPVPVEVINALGTAASSATSCLQCSCSLGCGGCTGPASWQSAWP